MGLLDKPPPLPPFQDAAFKSKLRVERNVVRIGMPLGICVLICFLTGLFSHFQQDPVSWLHIPASPLWLYRLTQGLHVATGIAAIPLIGIKLWSVYPNLFTWPAFKSAMNVIERLMIALLVAAMIFQVTTGLMNTAQWYPWSFGFRQTHFAIAFALMGALAIHLAFKGPGIMRALRPPVPHDPIPGTEPLDAADDSDASQSSTQNVPVHIDNNAAYGARDQLAQGGISRRGLFVLAGTSVGAATLLTVGQTFRPLEDTALLAPRKPDIGPQGLPINKTAASAKITPEMIGPNYRLTVMGPRPFELTIDELHALEQQTHELPIACVEGWSSTGSWTGVPMATLLDMAGIDPDASVRVTSLETGGGFGVSTLEPQFARSPLTLLALQLRGEALALDHGYPARIIAPNRPGVLQTKWVTRLEAL